MAIDYIDLMKSLQAFTFLENSLPLIYLLNIYGSGIWGFHIVVSISFAKKELCFFWWIRNGIDIISEQQEKEEYWKEIQLSLYGWCSISKFLWFFQIGASWNMISKRCVLSWWPKFHLYGWVIDACVTYLEAWNAAPFQRMGAASEMS